MPFFTSRVIDSKDATPPMTPAEIVTRFLDAFEARDFEAARTLLSDGDFRYDGPIDHFENATAFIDNISNIGQILKRIERRRVFADGGDVCVICSFWTTIDEIKHTRVALWCSVKGARITRIESFLDVRAYARMFAPEP